MTELQCPECKCIMRAHSMSQPNLILAFEAIACRETRHKDLI